MTPKERVEFGKLQREIAELKKSLKRTNKQVGIYGWKVSQLWKVSPFFTTKNHQSVRKHE